ncbi:sigma-70 family RNA polymerase sigma factor [Paradevosia shaoguanensis]|uniref:sigma-70 family RNA polymerase sigma factor n=1 Tax=Paradevosia shaoguanensis TaxID=1335043 RepID=UPI00050503F2|nr:sigma-70 family RNA polymerase sigma factor [Paradevosia shaoguanensis]KFL25358.1 RNA polymerase sigma factor [Devosia sp. 17-2-E-8]MBI4048477.1 sigma-70 family RNA polymerase sigma factor [Devosia nanyangense]
MSTFLDEIETCVPALRRYARALTRDADRADDLVQDCLERAIRKSALFRPRGPLRAWLFTMLLNLHRNGARSERRQGPMTPLDGLGFEPSVPPAQPGHIALAELARAIDTLPADQREALLLVVLEDMPYADAAAILGIPVGTLMSRLGRARAALRTMTGGDPQAPRLRTVK